MNHPKLEGLIADWSPQPSRGSTARTLYGDYVAGSMVSVTELPFAAWTYGCVTPPASNVLA